YYYYAYTESGLEATYEASPVVFAAPKVTGNIVVDREKTISGSTTGKPVILAAKLEQGKRYLFKETNIKDFSAFDSDYDSWYGGWSWNDGESVKYNICHVEKSGTYYFYVYPNKTDGKIQLTELKNLKKVTVDYSDMQDVYYYDPIVYHKYNGFLDYPDLEKIVYTLTFTDGTVEKVAYDALLTHIYGVYAYVSNYNGSLSIKGSYEKSYFDEERGEFKYDYIRFEKELTVKSVDEIPVLREGESVEVEADNNPSYVRLYVEKGLSYTISYNAPVVYSIDETGNDYSGKAAYSCKFTPKFSGYYYLKIETECDTTVTLERTKTAKSFDVSFNSDDFKCAYGDGFNPYGVDIVLLYADGESEVVEGDETEYAINGISYALKTTDGKTASKDALGNYPVGSYNLVYSVKGLTGTKKVPVIISGVRADYTIVYNSNGGTGSMKSQAAGKNKVVTLKTNAFKRAGYEFVGWSITPKLPLEFEAAPDAIDESRDYTDKEKVINLSSEGGKITLYAVWKVKKYTITYVLSGGRFTEDADVVYSFDVSGSDEIVLPTAEDMEEETGYTFEGWYTSNSYKASEKTEVIKAGSIGDKIFYAKWSPKTYKITFAGNGATSGNTKAQTASYGTWTKLNKNGFVKTDGTVKYGMIYWTVSGNESDEVYENQSSIWISEEPDCVKISQGDKVTILPKSTEEITLVANWQDTFTITLVGWDGSEREFTHKYGVEDKLSKKVTPIAHVGYTFGGWYLDEGLTKKITEIKKDVVSGFRIYERWTENTYTLKIDSNGGSATSVSKKLTYPQIAQIPANTYKKSGYTFAGWTTYANRNKVKALANKAAFDAIKDSIDYYDDAETIESLVTKNKGSITLYAIWYRANYILTLDYMDDNQADVEFEYLYSPLSSAKDVSSGDKIDSTPEFKSPKRE
ncbi:MAG: InlB B-repeat-containing protein, partial [Lachnospiraceae bacterium]|nr:InlB B-repeat-containing protein [Lachnospiraceae bacterium]